MGACPYPGCGGSNHDSSKYCWKCGKDMTKFAPKRHRSNRQKHYHRKDDRVTCGGCGRKMIPRTILGPPAITGYRYTPEPKYSICPYCNTKFDPASALPTSDGLELNYRFAIPLAIAFLVSPFLMIWVAKLLIDHNHGFGYVIGIISVIAILLMLYKIVSVGFLVFFWVRKGNVDGVDLQEKNARGLKPKILGV